MAHSHPSIEIVYHPSGHGVTRLNEQESISFLPGSAVIYSPHQLHDQLMESEGEDFCVQIALPKNECDMPRNGLYIPFVDSACVREEIHQLSRGQRPLSKTEKSIFDLRATVLLLELIEIASVRQAHAAADVAEQHVMWAEQYIRKNFAVIGSLPDLANHIGVHYDYLRHVFKARRGITLIRHLNDVRIERAKTLLKHSNLPLKQMAGMCGFKDEYYFSAVFRSYTKMSPGAYRNSKRE